MNVPLLKLLKQKPDRWMGLALPRFKCGHEKTPENTQLNNGFPRCAICHRARCEAYRRRLGIQERA